MKRILVCVFFTVSISAHAATTFLVGDTVMITKPSERMIFERCNNQGEIVNFSKEGENYLYIITVRCFNNTQESFLIEERDLRKIK